MRFSFELLSVTCGRVLSTDDSDWGAEDGVRVYFIVATTGGYHRVLVSGREYPPPDLVDNYSFVPGKTLKLNAFPPRNAGNWQLEPFDLSETDSVAVAVVGINEGLPWIGGGGGFGAAQAAHVKTFEEFAKEAADAAVHVTGGIAFSAAWTLLERAIEEINHASDCRGVVFCYQIELSMKKLLHDHLVRKESTHRLGSHSALTALGLVAQSKRSADCGSPQYDVEFRIVRVEWLGMEIEDIPGPAREGQRTLVEVQEEACRPVPFTADGRVVFGSEMYTWPVYVDRTITVTPSHFYPTLKPTWYVNGIELQRHADTLDLSSPGDAYVGDDIAGRPVSVRYERITHQGTEKLILQTRGEDGNYRLEVLLRLKFEGVHPLPAGPWVKFSPTIIWVTGTSLDGNAAWVRYMRCVMRNQIARLMVNYMPLDDRPAPPGPVEISTLRRLARQFVLPSVLDAHRLQDSRIAPPAAEAPEFVLRRVRAAELLGRLFRRFRR